MFRKKLELSSNESSVSKGKPITKPVTKVNFPTKPKNELGLEVIKPIKGDVSRIEDKFDIVSKLDEGITDSETTNIFDRVIGLTINVVDEVSVKVPDIRSITYPKLVRGADFIGYDVDFQISFNSVHASYIKLFIGKSTDFIRVSPNDSRDIPGITERRPSRNKSVVTLNVKDLIERYNVELFDEGDKVKIPIRLIPVNEDSREVVEGKVERIPIIFDKGDFNIPRQVAINRLAEGFISQFSNCQFDESNYLTNLLHLGDGNNQVITTWVGSENSLILKLYEPLPANITTNQKVWITKIQSKPIIDTISLVGDGDLLNL